MPVLETTIEKTHPLLLVLPCPPCPVLSRNPEPGKSMNQMAGEQYVLLVFHGWLNCVLHCAVALGIHFKNKGLGRTRMAFSSIEVNWLPAGNMAETVASCVCAGPTV
jgi:hypothetical protein